MTKHASNSPVTFLTGKRFAVHFFLPSCCVNSLVGTLRSNDADGNENVKKTKGLIRKPTTLHVHHAFLYISVLFLHDFDVKMPNILIVAVSKGDAVNKQRRDFISLPELEYGHLKFSFRRVRLHLTK